MNQNGFDSSFILPPSSFHKAGSGQLEEDLVCDVLGLVRIAHDPPRVRLDAAGITVVQIGQGTAITACRVGRSSRR